MMARVLGTMCNGHEKKVIVVDLRQRASTELVHPGQAVPSGMTLG